MVRPIHCQRPNWIVLLQDRVVEVDVSLRIMDYIMEITHHSRIGEHFRTVIGQEGGLQGLVLRIV